MGINLADIVTSEPRTLEDFSGKVLAIDAFNTLYQFLAIIRQPDGTPLMDHEGRVTSHLSGIIYRASNFVAAGIKPAFVFDGEPPRLKARTIVARGEIKRRAEREWREAVEIGDLATARTKAMQTSRLTGEMVDQSKRLLDLLGIPWIQAPAEGEAQASAMARTGVAYAAASQDFDSLLCGSPRLVKNLAITGRRKLPRKEVYVEVQPEEISLEATLRNLGITREQLVDMGLLIGTDFNEGVKGIGPKKALALIKKHESLEPALEELHVDIESKEEAGESFLSTVLTGALSALAYWRDVLTWDGSLAAFVVGMVIGIFGDVTWLFLLLFFLLSSSLATRYRFALKEALGVQEGVRGERKSTNVLANGFAPMAVAAISLTMPASFPKIISGVIFLSALSVAGADTLASEIWLLSRQTVLITTGEPVPPGTDGGVSRLGQLCAFGAAAYTSVAGWLVLSYLSRVWNLTVIPTMPGASWYLLIPMAIGFLGCQVDSVLGATLERRGVMDQKTVNLVSTTFGAVLAYVILIAAGPLPTA